MSKTITLVMHRQPKSIKEESEGCRMCLKCSGNFISMDSSFEVSSDSLSYWDAYNFCTNLNALSTDGLPQIICMECTDNLKFVYEVLKKAIQSNKMLKLIFERQQLEKDYQVLDEEHELKHMVEEAIEENADECYEDTQLEEYIYLDGSIKLSDEEAEYAQEIAYESCNSPFVDEKEPDEDIIVDDEKPFPQSGPQEVESKDILQTKDPVIDPIKDPLPPSPTSSTVKKTNREIDQMFMCEFCAKTFTTKQKLKMHTFVHTKEKNFECDLCPKRFNTIFKLREHLRAHANIRNHECTVCDLKFLTKHTLKCHMRRHTGERPYQCKICGKSFTQSSILKTHISLHQGKTAQCPHCPQKFSRPSHLILHQRSHTGERPYRCTLCSNSYKQKSHLDRHVDTHNGVKFVCEICSKQYTKKGSLKNHMYSHSENKPFKCTVCEKDFPSRDRFRRHMRHVHKTEVNIDCTDGVEDNTMTNSQQLITS